MVTLQFIPYSEIQELTSVGRIRKLLNIAKEDKIALLQGRLKKDEEAELIKVTMEEINKEFKGIELAVIYPNDKKAKSNFSRFRSAVTNVLIGDQAGLTIVGPATIVKSIRKNPNKIELMLGKSKKKKKGRGRR